MESTPAPALLTHIDKELYINLDRYQYQNLLFLTMSKLIRVQHFFFMQYCFYYFSTQKIRVFLIFHDYSLIPVCLFLILWSCLMTRCTIFTKSCIKLNICPNIIISILTIRNCISRQRQHYGIFLIKPLGFSII